ncbi:MAG TPA: peptide ABC transporter substrate-binding protein, partial [Chloroflexota bacterium]|nr:peptide ABC transporter substrate-binding protein [Chloroflexota bacterium]
VTTFKEPYAPYLKLVGISPWPKHALQGRDFNTYMNDRVVVSSGPYMFDYWRRNVEYGIKRNPNYWNAGKNDYPYLDRIKYRFLKDTNTLKIQLRTGEVDFILAVPDTNLEEELKAFPRSKFQSIPGGYWEHFAFNTSRPALKDRNVRKAIAHAIDRKQLAEVVLKGQTEPLHSTLLPQASQYFSPTWEQYVYDEAKIKEYMKAAGYERQGKWWTKGGKPIKIVCKSTGGNALRMKVAQLLQQAFKKNGIQMEIALEDPAVFFGQSVVQGSYDVAVWAWSSTVLSDQTTLFACDQIPSKANGFEGSNNYRYCNKRVTELLYESDRTPDVAERAEMIKEIQRLMAEDVPLVPLYQRPETVAFSNDLHGVSNNPLGGVLWNIHEWWVADR